MSSKKRIWVSNRVKELGKKKKDLAETLGLPHTRISDIISGNRALKLTEVKGFADFMEMSFEEVLNRFSMKDSGVEPSYEGLVSVERDMVALYRGLSESGKQKFQLLADEMKKAESD